jgi:Flp pilus assembly protein TadG
MARAYATRTKATPDCQASNNTLTARLCEPLLAYKSFRHKGCTILDCACTGIVRNFQHAGHLLSLINRTLPTGNAIESVNNLVYWSTGLKTVGRVMVCVTKYVLPTTQVFARHRGRLDTWRGARRGAVALEFAILAVPFLIMLLGVMEVSYDLYVQEELDTAVERASRSVQVGNVQGYAGESEAAFAAAAVCPALTGGLSCSALTVAVTPVPAGAGNNYFNQPPPSFQQGSQGCINTGTPGQLMWLVAWYDGPTFLGTLVPGFATKGSNGGLVHRTYASTGFVNEYFGGGEGGGGGCG